MAYKGQHLANVFSYVSWALDCKLGIIQVGMGAKYGF